MSGKAAQKEQLKKALKILGEVLEDDASRLALRVDMVSGLQKMVLGCNSILAVSRKVNLNHILAIKRHSFMTIKRTKQPKPSRGIQRTHYP